ncbi:FAD-binding domain-containing protein [Powellomyces hirtus]|nr:FAD-binding domain-containing protein [Powellomyces hirtus]
MQSDLKPLSDKEIDQFLNELDGNNNGYIEYHEVEAKLDHVHKEIAPHAQPHNLHHDSKADETRHQFLRSIIGSDADQIPRDEFRARVKEWNIPSLEQEKKEEMNEKEYMRSLSIWRRIRSYWAVHGPQVVFLAMVVSLQIAFATWQLVKYLTAPEYRPAFGWGVVVAKTCAGALYPTFFFLILSMSRYFSTFWRRSYHVSRFINWDVSQSFHIKMSIGALVLATTHAIGHLTGSFVFGSSSDRQANVAAVLGPDAVPRPYGEYVRSLPGWTGLTALGLFWTLALLSMPVVRKRSYEIFQLGHLLMFPIIGLLMAHGTAALLQAPMLGYWLAFPTLLVLVERLIRVCLVGFHKIPATLKILDGETVELTVMIPESRIWRYKAGQYVFLQVPKLSLFQWHPFTVSVCIGNEMQLHIKTDGNWTSKLRDLASEEGKNVEVGIDGPFGAPAQRFYHFSHSIVVGSGIGVTPFSGILADLQARDDQLHGGPNRGTPGASPSLETVRSSSLSPAPKPHHTPEMVEQAIHTLHPRAVNHLDESTASPNPASASTSYQIQDDDDDNIEDYRRVDFHWMVRDRNYLLWFSDLLNTVSRSQIAHKTADDTSSHLDIRIQTHVTAKPRKNSISTHIYRCLLEQHRTPEHPESPLTGLINATHFGRPDFISILDDHYDDMRKFKAKHMMAKNSNGDKSDDVEEDDELKVGVFFCGAPVIGEILSDKCRMLTARGRTDGSQIEYHFMMEVFG